MAIITRGDLYLLKNPGSRDPKRRRVVVVVGRQALVMTTFPTVVCAPVYTQRHGLQTEVTVGIEEGLKHESSIHCDELLSVPRFRLTHYIGKLKTVKLVELNRALSAALDLDRSPEDEQFTSLIQ